MKWSLAKTGAVLVEHGLDYLHAEAERQQVREEATAKAKYKAQEKAVATADSP